MDIRSLEQSFMSHFNAKPEFIVRAPGRVNLIGEHTDYNDGFVLPMAIDLGVWLALRPRTDSRVRVVSLDLDRESSFTLDSLSRGRGWAEYLKGMAFELQQADLPLRGFEAVMKGDVPRGAGLSSSAALELACARAFAAVSGFEWDAPRMAQLAQRAENEWVGVQCGIMDQMASAVSTAGHALFLDCRTLEHQHVPIPGGIAIVIMDTSTRRGLLDSAYNERRGQCETAARWFNVKALRDVDLETFEQRTKTSRGLDPTAIRRARHVITENARVREAVAAMQAAQVGRLGKLLNASHESLRADFEVTNDALNHLVACAREAGGCHGARMTGAGFGGCALALVDQGQVESFSISVGEAYRRRSGLTAAMYACKASQGASLVES